MNVAGLMYAVVGFVGAGVSIVFLVRREIPITLEGADKDGNDKEIGRLMGGEAVLVALLLLCFSVAVAADGLGLISWLPRS